MLSGRELLPWVSFRFQFLKSNWKPYFLPSRFEFKIKDRETAGQIENVGRNFSTDFSSGFCFFFFPAKLSFIGAVFVPWIKFGHFLSFRVKTRIATLEKQDKGCFGRNVVGFPVRNFGKSPSRATLTKTKEAPDIFSPLSTKLPSHPLSCYWAPHNCQSFQEHHRDLHFLKTL